MCPGLWSRNGDARPLAPRCACVRWDGEKFQGMSTKVSIKCDHAAESSAHRQRTDVAAEGESSVHREPMLLNAYNSARPSRWEHSRK